MLTKKSESNMNYFQCQHNNKGYCKFGHQCRYQHFNQICEKKVCRENECPSRHPKPCKNGQRCRFLKKYCCAYDHQYDSKNCTTRSYVAACVALLLHMCLQNHRLKYPIPSKCSLHLRLYNQILAEVQKLCERPQTRALCSKIVNF